MNYLRLPNTFLLLMLTVFMTRTVSLSEQTNRAEALQEIGSPLLKKKERKQTLKSFKLVGSCFPGEELLCNECV